jgi:hypothetical protein
VDGHQHLGPSTKPRRAIKPSKIRDVKLGKIVLRPPKAQTEEPAQPPARETPRRDNNRDRRKDK